MRSYYLFLPLAILLMASACEEEEQFEYSPTGYPFKFHVNAEGRTPNQGDFVHFRMYIRNEQDSIVMSTTKNKMGDNEEKDYITAEFKSYGAKRGDRPAPQMDVMAMMSAGDSATVHFRLDTLDKKPKGFEDSDVLYYDIALIDIRTSEEHFVDMAEVRKKEERERMATQARTGAIDTLLRDVIDQYNNGELDGKLQTMKSGLKCLIIEEGTGPNIKTANQISTNYYGMMKDKAVFDNSFRVGMPYKFLVGEQKVIEGWEQGFTLLKKNSKAVLFIPPSLAYGEQGAEPIVPPNAELIFYVEVTKVR